MRRTKHTTIRNGRMRLLALLMTTAIFTLMAFAPQTSASERYSLGKDALNERDWSTAASYFQSIFEESGERADAAGYWLAFSLFKQNDHGQALTVLTQLKSNFPESSWLDDAAALDADIRRAAGQAVEPDLEAESDLRDAAITSLLYMKAEEALPLIRKILGGDYSRENKERALFVLSQKKGEEARQLLQTVASENESAKLRSSAIHFLSMTGGETNLTFLDDLYGRRPEHRKDIIAGFHMADQVDRLRNLRKQEPDEELQVTILTFLAQTDAASEFGAYYDEATSSAEKQALITGMFIARQAENLYRVAMEETDAKLREDAINRMGLIQDCDRLGSLYEAVEQIELKKAVLNAMFLARRCNQLPALAENESDDILRIEAIKKLGLLGSAHVETLLRIYENSPTLRARNAVIEALFIARQDQPLIDIAKTEENPKLKQQAVQFLSILSTPKAREFLKSLLDL